MKVLASLLLSFFLLSTQAAFAHNDHSHEPITEVQAISVATEVLIELSSRDVGLAFGKLNQSWTAIPAKELSIYKKGIDYYIVSAFHATEKKTLYILMSNTGEVYDANFNGAFKGID